MPFIDRLKYRSSILTQILLVLVLGILILQVTNFLVVCHVQGTYVNQAEKIRAQEFVAYWRLFDSMTPAGREKALAALNPSGARVVQILDGDPHWQDTSSQVGRFINLAGELIGPSHPKVEARKQDNTGLQLGLHLPTLETAIALNDGQWLQVTEPLEVDDRAVVWTQRMFGVVS